MWQLLKPHLDMLMGSFVFPAICLTDEEIEQLEDDPVEYSRAHFGGKHNGHQRRSAWDFQDTRSASLSPNSHLQTSSRIGIHLP